jgi:hypothetical protein
MSQTTEPRSADCPVDPSFGPLDPGCLEDPYFVRLRGGGGNRQVESALETALEEGRG